MDAVNRVQLKVGPTSGNIRVPIHQSTAAIRSHSFGLWYWFMFLLSTLTGSLLAEDRCAICGGAPMGGMVYFVEDKVTHQKVEVCRDCKRSFTDCFVCSLPANTNTVGFVALPDGRALCARDAQTAVLREEEGVRSFHEVRDTLDRMFARFSGFPEKNLTVAMVDRIHLQELFTLAGNDYHCPNIFGFTQSETNDNHLEHRISLMTGLPLNWFQATCAHELSHAWVAENVPSTRRQRLVRETEEGFCELVAFIYSDSRNDEAEKAMILRNAYTRGQIDLFIAAYNAYGLNDVLDWMRYGTDSLLSASEPARIHKVALPQQKRPGPPTSFPAAHAEPPPTPTTLILKAVIWDAKRPLALINDRTFGVQEEGKVRLGTTNVTVRCLAIRQNAVRIQVSGTPGEQELVLKSK